MNLKILILNNGTRYINELASCMGDFGEVSVQEAAHFSAEGHNLVVLSGSYSHNGQHLQAAFPLVASFIQSSHTPILGICAGMQLMAVVNGAELQRLPAKIQGQKQVTLEDPFLKESFGGRIYADVEEHHICLVQARPNGFEVLGTSAEGIEIVRSRTKQQIGFQFHPELESPDGKALLEWALGELMKKSD